MCTKLSRIHIMRTNIVIDEKLMKETLRLTGFKTKREAVELGCARSFACANSKKSAGFAASFRGGVTWMR